MCPHSLFVIRCFLQQRKQCVNTECGLFVPVRCFLADRPLSCLAQPGVSRVISCLFHFFRISGLHSPAFSSRESESIQFT